MKKKIVKPKSAIPDLDDRDLLRAQRQKAEEMKRRQAEEEERRLQAEEDAKVRQAEDERAEAKRTADAERKRRDNSQARKLEDERRSLDEERRKIREEKERLERDRVLEGERRKLEDERRKLEDERRKLKAEPAAEPRRQTAKAKSSKRRAEEEDDDAELDQIDPSEMDEILALSREQTGPKGKPPVTAKRPTPVPQGRRATPSPEQGAGRPDGALAASRAKRATPAPQKSSTRQMKQVSAQPPVAELLDDGSPQMLVTRPETAQDWISDIKGGIDWRKVGLTYGAPALLCLVMLVFFGSAFMYGCVDLPEKRAKPTLAIVPKTDSGMPPSAPTPEAHQTWMPIGPIRIVVPTEGPISVDWERPSELRIPQATERIVMALPGWKLELRRHRSTAITEWLKDTHCSQSFLEHYVTVGDQKMVDDVMESTPDDFEWFSGPGWVQRFRDKLNLKDQLFPEIETGVVKVTYGGATGYYFGEPGRGDQRIELFNTTGHRLSYVYRPGGIKTSLTRLRNVQPSAPNYALPAKQAFEMHMEAYQKKDPKRPEPYRELLCAAMYAAGLAMSDDLAATKIDDVRTALTGSQFTKLLREDEKEASDAFDYLRGPTLGYLPELRRVLLGLYAHPEEKYQERARKFFEKLTGKLLAPGDTGYRGAENWVEGEEAREQ